MSRKDNKYGIAKSNILLKKLVNYLLKDQRTILLGTIVKIDSILGAGNAAIRCLDKMNSSFEDALYCCKISELIPIAERIWPLLLALPSPIDKVTLAMNTSLCDQIVTLQIGSDVEVWHNKTYYSAVIGHIGPVHNMGCGYYFGLALKTRTQITKYDGCYADVKYFDALPGTGLFVSVDKLKIVHQYLTSNKSLNFDSQNISTATENVAEVTYPEKSHSDCEMDLIELLGGSWPGVTDIKSNENIRLARNKSLNPMAHMLTTKKNTKISYKSEDINRNVENLSTNEPNHKEHWRVESPKPTVSRPEESNASYYDVPPSSGLSVGMLVEITTDISDPLYGVIRWVGKDGLAGIELEEDNEHLPLTLTDGSHKGQRHFTCAPGRALFVPITQCQKDSRFQDGPVSIVNSSKMFGQVDSPIVPGEVPPLYMPTEADVLEVCGKYRGIQGHHNSCYLDAMLFAMFTYTSVFDSLLFRPRTKNDIAGYEEVQKVLREEIVNPLRQNLYVRADRVMKLRTLLEDLSSVSGLTSEEKDPEEFLNSLLAQILKAEPFLKLSSGQEAFHYQLFVEKDEGLALPSVQQLFEQSFLSSDIKLKEVPSCLIIQMPRFGKNFKMYPRILPSQLLDVTDIIENSPRQCTVCGKLAQFECRECFGQCGMGLESTGFCASCLETAHCHVKRSSHSPKPLTVPHDFAIIAEHCSPPRLYMELFAVVCIETSHYVTFVKCGSGHEAPWCFFDSMADRKGEVNGYNIPEMVACPDVSNWLSDDGGVSRMLHEATPNDKQLPEHARRLLCDAYICMYQSPDVMMYR